MKFTVDGYEIEIKAKNTCGGLFDRKRAKAEDAKAFMRDVALLAARAADRYAEMNCFALSRNADRIYHEIHDQLNDLGYYDNLAGL